jgi:hypothetical protein
MTQAEILMEQKDFEAAAQMLNEIGQIYTPSHPIEKLGVLLLMCFVNTGLGQLEQAHQQLNEINSIGELDCSPRYLMMRAAGEARLAAAEKCWDAAFSAYGTCHSIASQAGLRWHQALIRSEWAQALAQRNEPGDLPHARAMMREAMALFEQMTAFPYVARLQEKLSQMAD